MDTLTLLVDLDIIIYRICWACQDETHWEDDVITLSVNKKELEVQLDASLHHYMSKLGSEDMILCASDKNNFRRKILPSYKENRKSKRKPLGYKHLLQYALDNYNCRIMEGLEADDVLGILATTPDSLNTEKIILSIDKDMLTIPCTHYNLDKDTLVTISKEEANHNFYIQVLTGDNVDNYKGCPGVGPKNASKLLLGCVSEDSYWSRVLGAFINAGLTEEDALVQARVARILRHEDYDYFKKDVRLWEPKVTSSMSVKNVKAG